MFHFPTSPPHRLCIHLQVTPHNWCWVSPFGHPRINALLATPRGLTQPHTSFIGPACQGIHHTPVTQNNNYGRYKKLQTTQQTKITQKEQDARVHYTVLTQHTPHEDQPPQQMINQQWNATTRNTQCCPRHPTACQHTINFIAAQTYLALFTQACTPSNHTPYSHKHENHGWVCLHPDIFKTNWWQYHTRVLNHHTHNCGRKIKAP